MIGLSSAAMSVLPRRAQPLLRQARLFHSSLVRADLVGPPDPVSHLRPVIYDDAPVPPSPTQHPYSLREFTGDVREYQWKVQRQETDAFNQAFWTNVRYPLLQNVVHLSERCFTEQYPLSGRLGRAPGSPPRVVHRRGEGVRDVGLLQPVDRRGAEWAGGVPCRMAEAQLVKYMA